MVRVALDARNEASSGLQVSSTYFRSLKDDLLSNSVAAALQLYQPDRLDHLAS
jgi:hypothetical protein